LTSGISLITFSTFLPRTHLANINHSGSNDTPKKRIMIVDDEKDIASVFRSGLERNGFSVEVYNDPLEALSHFKPEYYDLLLLDVRMPGMSGFELCGRIRMQDKTTRVCFISAFEVHEEEMRKYLPEEDEKCVLRKPISTKELVKIINEEISDSS